MMRNYRLFVLGFVTASFILLTGFEKSGVHNVLSPAAKKTVSKEVKKVPSKSKLKTKKAGHNQNEVLVPSAEKETENIELQKPLDLSLSFDDSVNAGLTIEQNKAVQKESLNVFSSEKKKKQRPLYFDGQMLMSQEPEVDKQKSVDGAGIVINLKR
ncbi:MAG: hypothetical protein ACXWTY_10400 [Methylobacter sp.]|jgi:hypothetical protein